MRSVQAVGARTRSVCLVEHRRREDPVKGESELIKENEGCGADPCLFGGP